MLCAVSWRGKVRGRCCALLPGLQCKEWFKAVSRRFGLNNRKHNFTERVVRHRMPRKMVYSSTLPAFERHLDNALNTIH